MKLTIHNLFIGRIPVSDNIPVCHISYTATGAGPDVAGVICRWIAPGRGYPSRFRPLRTSGTALDDHFQSADARVENNGNRIAIRLTVDIHWYITFYELENAPERHLKLWALMLSLVENDWINFTRFIVWPVRWVTRRIISKDSLFDFERIPPWRWQSGRGVPERRMLGLKDGVRKQAKMAFWLVIPNLGKVDDDSTWYWHHISTTAHLVEGKWANIRMSLIMTG